MRLYFFVIVLLSIICPGLQGQSICEQRLRDADAARNSNNYLSALRKYTAARNYCAEEQVIDERIEAMFTEIQALKSEAERQQNKVYEQSLVLEQTNKNLKDANDLLSMTIQELEEREQALQKALDSITQLSIEQELLVREKYYEKAIELADASHNMESVNDKSLLAIQAKKFNSRYANLLVDDKVHQALRKSIHEYKRLSRKIIYSNSQIIELADGSRINVESYGYPDIVKALDRGHVRDMKVVGDKIVNATENGAVVFSDLELNSICDSTWRHQYVNRCLDVSPNEEAIAVGGNAQYILIFNMQDICNEPIVIERKINKIVLDIKFTSDSTLLILSSGNNIETINISTGVILLDSLPTEGRVKRIEYNSKQKMIYFIENGILFQAGLSEMKNKRLLLEEEVFFTDLTYREQQNLILLVTATGKLFTLDIENNLTNYYSLQRNRIERILAQKNAVILIGEGILTYILLKEKGNIDKFYIKIDRAIKVSAATFNKNSKITFADTTGKIWQYHTDSDEMVEILCSFCKKKSFFDDEWEKYIGSIFKPEKQCE